MRNASEATKVNKAVEEISPTYGTRGDAAKTTTYKGMLMVIIGGTN